MAGNDNLTEQNKDSKMDKNSGVKTASQTRREFIKKYGKLAAVTPVALTTLMSPETSAAPKSCKPQQGNKHCPPEPASNGF
ncbi:hypothetical protein [Thalassotalea sp. Y01]|uniref:hypothetical protein n=1 Tax=Thalassotalea sp. Y01 TaxID=2729613 RepID=UPI00145DE5C4|nr:hypothetical protein [Thalassotalea sp. Y01]NMP16479.1 hypothetical protein [Thalassotalea sp. Y01]